MYVCICICLCICICMCICLYVCVFSCVCVHAYVRMYVCVCICVCVSMHEYVHLCIFLGFNTHTYFSQSHEVFITCFQIVKISGWEFMYNSLHEFHNSVSINHWTLHIVIIFDSMVFTKEFSFSSIMDSWMVHCLPTQYWNPASRPPYCCFVFILCSPGSGTLVF